MARYEILIGMLFAGVVNVFAVNGYAVSTVNGQGYLQYYGRTDGQLWRHTITDDMVTEHKKLFDGPCTRPCISPNGKNVAFLKGNKVSLISIDGGNVTELATCHKNSWVDFPHDEWVYYIQEGSFHDPNSNTLKRVNINTKAVETVVQFKNSYGGGGARVAQIQISNDLKRAVIRPGDNSESAPLGTILKYDFEQNKNRPWGDQTTGNFGPVLSNAWSCAAGISSDGQYALDGWAGHDGFDIRKWSDGSTVTSVNNSNAYKWAPHSDGSLPSHHAIFHSGGATNDPHWICIVVGSSPGHDQRNDIHRYQVLINWQDKRCICVTKDMSNANFFDHGDFWVEDSTAPIVPDSGMFTCSDSVNAEGGKPFGFKLTYRVTGMVKPTIGYAKKPLWLNTTSDSVFGKAPEEERVDTLRAILKNGQEGLDTIDIQIFVEYEPPQNVLPGNGYTVSEPAKVSIVSNNGSVQFAVQADVSGKYELTIYSLVGERVHGMSWYSIKGENRIWNLPKTIWRSNVVYFVVLRGPGGLQPYRMTALSCQ